MNEKSIFAAALEQKTDSARQAYLDDVCFGNVQLRAQVEVEAVGQGGMGTVLWDWQIRNLGPRKLPPAARRFKTPGCCGCFSRREQMTPPKGRDGKSRSDYTKRP